MTKPLVRIDDDGPARWLVLDRPDKLNAFNAEMAAELRVRLETAVADDSVRVIVLTGAGRAFSAGQDLEERRNVGRQPIDLAATLKQNWHPLLSLIRAAQKPVIAAVNGLASGAAANLALACDIVVAARSASFAEPFVNIGLLPDCGAIFTLPRLVGDARARALMLLAATIDAETAERIGLVYKTATDARLREDVQAMAVRLAAAAPLAIAATKRALSEAAAARGLDEALAIEAREQRALGASQDYAEAIAAFFDKRRPQFKGS